MGVEDEGEGGGDGGGGILTTDIYKRCAECLLVLERLPFKNCVHFACVVIPARQCDRTVFSPN